MTTAIIGTGGLGSVIARVLASGGETLRLSSADSESARTLAAKIGGAAVAAADNHDALQGADAVILALRFTVLKSSLLILPSGRVLTVPTAEETLRIKGFLIVRRNQTRDYLDVAALSDSYGIHEAAEILARIDDYYSDQHGGGKGVAAQLARQLADPRPKDSSVTGQLDAYRNLAVRWTDWGEVRSVCRQLAAEMLEVEV